MKHLSEDLKDFIVQLAERCEHAKGRAIDFARLGDLETCGMYGMESERLALVAWELAA